MEKKIGTLYGVSVGTGDPELITVKGLKVLQNSPVVAFPEGIKQQSGVAEKIIQQYLQPKQLRLSLSFPYTLSQVDLSQAWHSVSVKVWQYLEQGLDVAFACEGDISFYSTFSYLALSLQKLHPQVKIDRIPGVSSPMVSASALSLPLTMQEEKLVVLPALYTIEQLEEALDWAEIVVLMKVASVYEQVWQILKQRNLFSCSYLIEKASTTEEKIYPELENHPQLSLSYFSLLIICQRQKKLPLITV